MSEGAENVAGAGAAGEPAAAVVAPMAPGLLLPYVSCCQ